VKYEKATGIIQTRDEGEKAGLVMRDSKEKEGRCEIQYRKAIRIERKSSVDSLNNRKEKENKTGK